MTGWIIDGRIVLGSGLFIFGWHLAKYIKKVMAWVYFLLRVLRLAFVAIAVLVGTVRPSYYHHVYVHLYHKYLKPLIQTTDQVFAALSADLPAPKIDVTHIVSRLPSSSSYLWVLLVVAGGCFCLVFKNAEKRVSGGRCGQIDENNSVAPPTDPVLLTSVTNLLTALQGFWTKNSTPHQNSTDCQQLILEKLDTIAKTLHLILQAYPQGTPDYVLAGNSSSNSINQPGSQQQLRAHPSSPPTYSLGLENPERPFARTYTPMTEEMLEKIVDVSQEEAIRILQEESKLRREGAKKPKFLSETEKTMPTDKLYMHLKQQNLRARESQFLEQLPTLPKDASTWSVADINRWFRDQRHEQWAIRKLREGKTLFICPHCNRARDAESHRCVNLWSRTSVSRTGVPTYQRTFLTPSSPGSFRVATSATPDHQKVIELQENLTSARRTATEANERLARAYAAAQAIQEQAEQTAMEEIFGDDHEVSLTDHNMETPRNIRNTSPSVHLTQSNNMSTTEVTSALNSQATASSASTPNPLSNSFRPVRQPRQTK